MVNHEYTYTSTGLKILRHLDVLRYFRNTRKIRPISLQIAPTSRCNLKCSFCSNVNRKEHEDINMADLITFIDSLASRGAKTVEWTGGGDPTQFPFIRNILAYASHKHGLQQGFITNGIDLVKKVGSSVCHLDWIRISLNSLEYVDDIDIPSYYEGVLGFSYVMNQKTNYKIIARINQYIEKYKPKYVRIVPDCQIPAAELEEMNKSYARLVKDWGPPYFYQAKKFSVPSRCWWGYFKPFLLHNGYVYPCSSVVLNDTAERSFHDKFKWMTMQEFAVASESEAIPFVCKHCSCCVFGEQNKLIEAVINPEMENFI